MLFSMPSADLIRNSLHNKGIAIRRCDTFVGLDEQYLRAAVRPEWPLLVEAIAGVLPVSVRLRDVIEVLDEAYPPRLAQSWDSVGLVCGDPQDVLDSVTIAVDATPAVVDEVPEAGLLLAHHPLLLRGVDTVAASTPKGALIHRLIRTGRSLFTAHTNADSASPGVSDALAHALGLTVEAVLEPLRARVGWKNGSSTCRARTQRRCRRPCLRPAPATSAIIRTAAGASPERAVPAA